jgi:hypothetical protein
MSEHQNRPLRPDRETSQRKSSGGDDARARKALDDRWEAVRRWIDADDESCCRGID